MSNLRSMDLSPAEIKLVLRLRQLKKQRLSPLLVTVVLQPMAICVMNGIEQLEPATSTTIDILCKSQDRGTIVR